MSNGECHGRPNMQEENYDVLKCSEEHHKQPEKTNTCTMTGTVTMKRSSLVISVGIVIIVTVILLAVIGILAKHVTVNSGSNVVITDKTLPSTTDKTLPSTTDKTITTDKAVTTTVMEHRPGAVYTRWGRTSCPDQTEMLYKGIAAGSRWDQTGGMANILCLPKFPDFGNFSTSKQSSFIYGAEYNMENDAAEAVFGPQWSTLKDNDVPCTVCMATGRPSHLMVPARVDCFDEWNLEYVGYLMTSFNNHKATDVICVDKEPEVVYGQSSNEDGRLLYFVEAAGQLPDPPYIKGRELVCVVCTR